MTQTIRLAGRDIAYRIVRSPRRRTIALQIDHDGLQVHRSYWVARKAVTDFQKNGNALEILLKNGEIVPVSRSFKVKLKEVGWLDGPVD